MTDYDRGYAAAIEAAAKECDHWQNINQSHKCGTVLAHVIRALRPSCEFVCVPREPTNEIMARMVEANVAHEQQYPIDGIRRSARIYKAMLRAAEGGGE